MSHGREPSPGPNQQQATKQGVAPAAASSPVVRPTFTYGSAVLCPQSSGEEDRVSYCRGVVAVVNQDTLSVDLDPEYFGGKTKRWTGSVDECLATYSAPELEKGSDNLLHLPERCEEAVVDALRWRFIQSDQVFTYCGRVLLAFNPFRANQKPQEPDKPHILDLCSKVTKMRSITGRPCAVILSGESGSGKTEMARQVLRFLTPEGSTSSAVTSALGSMSTILETFGNANLQPSMPNASRFGLWCKILPSGAGLGAASCTQLLLERSRVTARDELERSFHVFYQLLAGLSRSEKQGLDLLSLGEYAYLASSEATNEQGSEREDAKNFAKLLPALADIGVKGSIKDDLLRCLGGILACGNAKWIEEDLSGNKVSVCTDPKALQRVARCFGLADVDALRDGLAHGEFSAQRRMDNLAETIYAGLFSWLVKRLNSQLGDLAPNSRWIGLLDFPGFGNFEFNSFEQLLFNHAEEELHRVFLEQTLIEERKALTAEGVDSATEIGSNGDVIQLVEGSSPQPGIFAVLEKCLDNASSDDEFAEQCSASFQGNQLLSVRQVSEEDSPWASTRSGHRFTINHTVRPVEYCVAGFRERSVNHLPDRLIQVLRSSENTIIRDIASSEDLATKALRGRRSCEDIKQVLEQLRGADVDLHFVKCFLPNREGSTNRAEGCFDWQFAWSACRGYGVIDAVRLQWQSGKFTQRISFNQFLAQFGALGLSSLKQFQREPGKAIEGILTQEVPKALQNKEAIVGNSMILMTQDCFDALKVATVKIEQGLKTVAEFVQQATRAYSVGTQCQEDRDKLVKLQACVRRRRVLGPEISRVSTRRQFFGIMRVMQAVDLIKPKREAAITIEAHLRTVAARQQYRDSKKQRQEQRLASLVLARLRIRKARQELINYGSTFSDESFIAGALESAFLRKRLMKFIEERGVTNLQSIRRGKVERDKMAGAQLEQQGWMVFSDAVETLFWRIHMSNRKTTQVALSMQSHRRAVLGRRKMLEARSIKQGAVTISSALETIFSRMLLVRAKTEKAAVILQKDRRCLVSTRKVQDVREDKNATAISRALFSAALCRKWHAENMQKQSVLKLQSVRRANVAHRRVQHVRDDVVAWKKILGPMISLLERKRMMVKRSTLSASRIQNNARGMLARKQTHTMKFVRLQKMLAGTYQSLRAKELILRLQAENWKQLQIRRLCCAFETVAWRRQHVQRREYQATLAIQRCYRGTIGRRRAYHIRNVVAQEILHRVLRTFEARHEFVLRVRRSKIQGCVDLICAVMSTVRLRGHHHMARRHHKATDIIQRMARGYMVRKDFKKNVWNARAEKAKKTLHGVMQRFNAIQYLLDEKDDILLDQMNTQYLCVLRTLQARKELSAFKKTVHLSQAAVVIQKSYRGWSTRRKPAVRMITAAINRVGLENKDRSLQRGHAAASMIQAIWRSWISRQVLLLPRVIHHLSVERTRLYDMRMADVSALKNFRNVSTAAEKTTHILLGGTTILNMAMPSYGHPAKKPFRNWGQVIVALEHKGEQMMELGFGKQHAITTSVNGVTYTYTCPDTMFTNEDAVLTEDNFVLTPLSFRGNLKDPAPIIIKVACGERHAVMLSEQGLVYTWGMNDRSQCGVGTHLPERYYTTAVCLQKWGHHKPAGVEPNAHETFTENLPRVKAISCGPNHSGMVDAEGQLWFWGAHSGIGLFNLKAVKGDLGIPSFLLFRMSQDIHKHHKSIAAAMRQTPQKAQNGAKTAGSRTPPLATQDMLRRLSRPRSANATMRSGSLLEAADSISLEDGAHISAEILSKMHLSSAQAEQMGSLRFMLTEAQDFVAIKEISGDVHMPTRCSNLVLCPANEAGRMRAAGTPVIDCWVEGWCSPVFPAPARGVHFIGIELGSGINTALSDRGYVYTWGTPEKGMLGRPVKNRFKPVAPERIPFFPQLAISLTSISAGMDHILALTTHGRVFTWGKVDACLGPSGFQRCTLEEPMFVEGIIRELRVVQIAAGRLESAIATEGFDKVMGWDMLEMSNVGHRMLPVAYEYTFTGRKPGYSDAKFERLRMAQSDAVQCLLLGGRLPCGEDHLFGLEPFPDDETKLKGRHFMKKNEGIKKNMDLTRPNIPKKPVAKGMAAKEMFQWAEKNTKIRAAQKHLTAAVTDPRLKRAAASMVSLGFASKSRDIMEVERDLGGFRRLALSRQDSAVIAVDSSEYKIRNYDAHEEFADGESVAPTDLASSFVDSVDGAVHRRSTISVSRPTFAK